MHTSFGNYNSNRSNANKINYDELLKSRNEIMKQCMNQSNLSNAQNMSYESNRSLDGFHRSQYVPKKGKRTQMDSRKSTTNLIPARSKKPKFILKKQGQQRYLHPFYRERKNSNSFCAYSKANLRNRDLMMDQYLNQFSCNNEESKFGPKIEFNLLSDINLMNQKSASNLMNQKLDRPFENLS